MILDRHKLVIQNAIQNALRSCLERAQGSHTERMNAAVGDMQQFLIATLVGFFSMSEMTPTEMGELVTSMAKIMAAQNVGKGNNHAQ